MPNENIENLINKFKQFYFKYVVSDEGLIKQRAKRQLGLNFDLKNPKTYNEKLQWLKLHWRNPLASKCADKYEVRKYIEKKIGKKYLNELYGVYESVDEININKLPNSFVLKATHGSGYNIICFNKEKMDWDKEFTKMNQWLNTNYYWRGREWVYKNLKPRIICERFLDDGSGNPPEDYKIFCFDGEPKIIQVDFDRFNSHTRNYYDLEWNLLDLEIKFPSDKSKVLKRPPNLLEMLELSKTLSKGFPHVRVDFYNVKERIIFGEMTFFPESGFGRFNSQEYEIQLGSYIDLTKVNTYV